MNVITLAGRVATDPVRRETDKSVVSEFRLAVECKPRLWIMVQCWGAVAGRAAHYLSKGRMIAVSGQLRSDEYVTRAGVPAIRWYVRATSISFLDKPADVEALAEVTK